MYPLEISESTDSLALYFVWAEVSNVDLQFLMINRFKNSKNQNYAKEDGK